MYMQNKYAYINFSPIMSVRLYQMSFSHKCPSNLPQSLILIAFPTEYISQILQTKKIRPFNAHTYVNE